jgi:hypothetical protein
MKMIIELFERKLLIFFYRLYLKNRINLKLEIESF